MKKVFEFILDKVASRNLLLKYFTAIFPGVGTVILIFLKDPIYNATYNAVNYWYQIIRFGIFLDYLIDWTVVVYYILVFLWILSYALYILNDNKSNQENARQNKEHLEQVKSELNGAIHNAPNPEVFSKHLILFKNLSISLDFIYEHIRNETITEQIYELFFTEFFESVCSLTKIFSKNEKAFYGANIMRYYKNSEINKDFIEEVKADKARWPYFRDFDVKYVRGILIGVPTLKYVESSSLEIPTIAIPLIKREDDKEIILPGASRAAIEEESTINITNPEKTDEFKLFESPQQKEVAEYFQKIGNRIKSVTCHSIPLVGPIDNHPNALKCLGVINIDCDQEFVLGEEEKYFATFSSLIRPILALVAPVLDIYLQSIDSKKS